MKALKVDQHDYITVSAVVGTCRLSMTANRWGCKATASSKANDVNSAAFTAVIKSNMPVLNKLMRAGFSKLSPKGQEVTVGNGAIALKAMVEASKDHADLFAKLDAALGA
jgi:hypothetical protein